MMKVVFYFPLTLHLKKKFFHLNPQTQNFAGFAFLPFDFIGHSLFNFIVIFLIWLCLTFRRRASSV